MPAPRIATPPRSSGKRGPVSRLARLTTSSGAAGNRSTACRIPGSPRSRRSKSIATSAASTTSVTSDRTSTRAAPDLVHEGAHQAGLVPPRAKRDRGAGDLAGDDADPVVVELLAEAQVRGAALVEAGRGHRAVDDHGADGLVEGPVGAAQLDRGVDAAVPTRPAPGPRHPRARRPRTTSRPPSLVPRRAEARSSRRPPPRPRRARRAGWRAARSRPARRPRCGHRASRRRREAR